jgi:hypothetical protein
MTFFSKYTSLENYINTSSSQIILITNLEKNREETLKNYEINTTNIDYWTKEKIMNELNKSSNKLVT